MSRRALLEFLLGGGMAALIPTTPSPAQESGSLERAVKATYLWKFAPFIEWPASAFKSPDSPFAICLLGSNPFGNVLDEAVAGQRILGRPISIRHLSTVSGNSGCQILFDAGSPEQSIAAGLKAVQGAPVLTVTDSQDNGGPKGIINFVIEEGHVRFEINDATASANGLTISSKLLSLAVAVTPRTEKSSRTRVA